MEKTFYIVVPINAMGLCGMTENAAVYDERDLKFFPLASEERYSISSLFSASMTRSIF